MSHPLQIEALEKLIHEIRGARILLDSDVARIYGVDTKRINEAVKNNPDKFPKGYLLQLTKVEWDGLKSKISTSNRGGKVKLPFGFPEKGLYMLATILKSKQATEATFTIIETFAKLRQLTATVRSLSLVKDKGEQKSLMHRSGELVSELFDEDFQTTDSETSIELNFAVLKFKHTIKRKKE